MAVLAARVARSFAGGYALAYALLGLLLVATYWTVWVWHQTASVMGRVWFPWRGDRPASDTVYLLTMTVVGLLLFLFIVIGEGVLRSAARRRAVLPAFLRLAVVQAVLAGSGALLLEFLLRR